MAALVEGLAHLDIGYYAVWLVRCCSFFHKKTVQFGPNLSHSSARLFFNAVQAAIRQDATMSCSTTETTFRLHNQDSSLGHCLLCAYCRTNTSSASANDNGVVAVLIKSPEQTQLCRPIAVARGNFAIVEL